jgi:hypothetical protein
VIGLALGKVELSRRSLTFSPARTLGQFFFFDLELSLYLNLNGSATRTGCLGVGFYRLAAFCAFLR